MTQSAERGTIMVLVITILAALLAAAAVALYLQVSSTRAAGISSHTRSSLYCAEAGLAGLEGSRDVIPRGALEAVILVEAAQHLQEGLVAHVPAQHVEDHGALAVAHGLRGGGGAGALVSFLPLILIFFIFYLLVFRPQQKRQKQHRAMLEALKKGDRVVTSGGLYGTVIGVKSNVAVLKIAENVKAEFQRSAITAVVAAGEGSDADAGS